MTVIFPSGNSINQETIERVQKKIREVLKEELPEPDQVGEVVSHILLDLEKKKESWGLKL